MIRRLLLALVLFVGVVVAIDDAPPAAAGVGANLPTAASFASGRGKVGIAVLDRTTREYRDNGANAHARMGSASIMKMFIAEDLLTRSRSGARVMPASDRALLERMIIRSDDAAASSLYNRYGGSAIISRVRVKYNLAEITLPSNPRYWGTTGISAAAIAHFYDALPVRMNRLDFAYLTGLMRKTSSVAADGFGQHFGIPTSLSKETWGVKQGWMCCFDNVRNLHTTGYLGADNRYIVVVLTAYSTGQSWQYGADTLNRTISLLFPGGSIVSRAPVGGNDPFTKPRWNVVRVSGWTFDPDSPKTALRVHVQLNGVTVRGVTASVSRPGVGKAYPAAGPAHGYSVDVGLKLGTNKMCTYAMNVGSGPPNILLGCQTLVSSADPIGRIDSLSQPQPGSLRIAGWALDPDVVPTSTRVHFTVNGTFRAATTADLVRTDVNQKYPGTVAAGFNVTVNVGSGAQRVCATAFNQRLGKSVSLGCRSITTKGASAGSVKPAAETVEPNQPTPSTEPTPSTPVSPEPTIEPSESSDPDPSTEPSPSVSPAEPTPTADG